MTDLRAIIVSARLEIFVEYSAEVKAALAVDDAAITEGLKLLPEHARPAHQPFHRSFSPHVERFCEGLPWSDIRAEFARKAKKIGLAAKYDIPFQHEKDGVLLWCIAEGRA
jgi:hypothetical protein